MNPCVYCGEVFRIVQHYCPHCGEINPASPTFRSRFDRIQLTIKLGGWEGETAAQFQSESLTLLKQDMGLAEIATEIERSHNGRYTHYTTILRHLSDVTL